MKLSGYKSLIITMIYVFSFYLFAVSHARVITDGVGRKVAILSVPKRIASFVGTSYETIFLLGESDKVKYISSFQLSPWAIKLNPDLKHVHCLTSSGNPNIEDLIREKIDTAFYWPWPQLIDQMQNAGITVVCPPISGKTLQNNEEFKNRVKNNILFYQEIIGTRDKTKIEAYLNYFDTWVTRIARITSKIDEKERPKVYYVGGPNVFETHDMTSNTYWYIKLAGGIFVPAIESDTHTHIILSMEQIATLNPDIIMMGRLPTKDPVLTNPQWACTNAVKNGRVYLTPEGVFYWDHSSEGILLLMFFAKTFHPEKFKDINILDELKYFYFKFYGYSLTNDEAVRILNHLPPVG